MPRDFRGNQGSKGLATASVNAFDSRIGELGAGLVTERVAAILSPSDEQMVWQERPSPILLVGLASRYMAVILLACLMRTWFWAVFWLFIGAIHLGIRFYGLYTTNYALTSQRLEVTSGILNQTKVTYEVHHIENAVIVSPLILRLFGRSNLTVGLPRGGSSITLYGIQKADFVRDVIRGASQIEGNRTDLIRWR